MWDYSNILPNNDKANFKQILHKAFFDQGETYFKECDEF